MIFPLFVSLKLILMGVPNFVTMAIELNLFIILNDRKFIKAELRS